MADIKVGTLYYTVELRGAEDAKRQAASLGGMGSGGGGSGAPSGSRGGGVSGAPGYGMGGGGGGYYGGYREYSGHNQVQGVRGEDRPPPWARRYRSPRYATLPGAGMHYRGGGGVEGIYPGGGDESEGMPEATASNVSGLGRPVARRGGFFSMPGGRRLAMQAMFGAWEVGRALQGEAMVENPLNAMNGGNALMAAQAQGIQQMGGGIFGSMAKGALDLVDMAAMAGGADMANAERGFGVLGRFSPFAMSAAQAGAQRGLSDMRSMTEAMGLRAAYSTQARAMTDQAGALSLRDPYLRGIANARNEYAHFDRSLEDQLNNLDQQIKDAKSGPAPDIALANKLTREYNELARAKPRLEQGAADVMTAKIGDIQADAAIQSERLTKGAYGATLRAMGHGPEADLVSVNAQFLPRYDRSGKVVGFGDIDQSSPVFDATNEAFEAAKFSTRMNTSKRRYLEGMGIEGETRALQYEADYKPLQAQVERMTSAYATKMQAMADDDISSPNIDKLKKEASVAAKALMAQYLMAGQAVQGSIFSDTTGGQSGSQSMQDFSDAVDKFVQKIDQWQPTITL